MKRVMVNLDDATGDLVEAQARRDGRSASGYIARLVLKDLESAGLINANSSAEVLAAAEQIGFEKAADILVRHARKKKAA